MKQTIIAIDFGTKNIKVSKLNDKKNEPSIVKLGKSQSASESSIPNAIYYNENENLMGHTALQRSDYKNRVEYIKKRLELSNWTTFIPNKNKDLSAVEVASDIFSWIYKELSDKTSGSEVFETIITIPVCYSEVQKNRIKKCAEKSGFIVKEILLEPLAALFFDEELFEDDNKVLIFDFGGGTLDLTLSEIENDGEDIIVKVLSSNGIKFGGYDITNLIYNNFIDKKFDELNENMRHLLLDDSVYNEFIQKIESCKETLFNEDADDDEEFDVNLITKCGDSINININKEEVNGWFDESNYNKKIIEILDTLIEDADIDKTEITKIKLVGGTSRIDYFQNVIYEYFGEDDDILDLDDLDDDDIFNSVCCGAVNYVKLMEDDNFELQNRIAYSIGHNSNNNFESLISKNAKYGYISPKKGLKYSSLKDNKFMIYQVFQIEDKLSIDDNKVVYAGYFEIDINKYDNKDNILFEVQISKKGKMIGRFYNFDGDINLIETLELKVGE